MTGQTALLVGNYRPTLTIARRLRPFGYRFIVTRRCGDGGAEVSRVVDDVWDHPSQSDEPAFITALSDYLTTHPEIGIVYPISEPCVALIARHRHLLPADRLYATPASETVLTCLDKTRMLQVAVDAGVPCAPFRFVSDYAALIDTARDIGFPIVVRPITSDTPIAGRKALIAETEADLVASLPAWPRDHARVIVQSFVTGPRHNFYFAAQNGRLIRALGAEILRTDMMDGTGFAVDGRTIPVSDDLRDYAENLVAQLGYNGVGCIQFLVDRPKQIVSFLELNPRIAGNHAIAEAAGLELSRLSIDLATPDAPREDYIEGRAGMRYAWTYCDLYGIKKSLERGDLKLRALPWRVVTLLRTAFAADVHMTWCWHDPLPTLFLFARQIPGLGRFLKRRDARPPRIAAPMARP
ncbi:MAG: hypothetical protein AAFX39_06080 [Pseudomonadota bacterium]